MPAADARTIWNGLAGDWVRHIRSVPGDEGDMVRRTMLNALILELAGDCSGKAVLDNVLNWQFASENFARGTAWRYPANAA